MGPYPLVEKWLRMLKLNLSEIQKGQALDTTGKTRAKMMTSSTSILQSRISDTVYSTNHCRKMTVRKISKFENKQGKIESPPIFTIERPGV
jgi:hypothetical protein